MVVFGLIGGSGLMKSTLFSNLTDELVDTAHGRVLLRTGTIGDGVKLVFVQRHGAKPTREYAQPADINYPAVALALKAKVRTTTRGVLLLLACAGTLLQRGFFGEMGADERATGETIYHQ